MALLFHQNQPDIATLAQKVYLLINLMTFELYFLICYGILIFYFVIFIYIFLNLYLLFYNFFMF